MCRYLLYIIISSLAFGVGIFTSFNFYRESANMRFESHEINQNSKLIPVLEYQLPQIENFKYNCREKELESFWEALDKENFLKFMKENIKIRSTDFSITSNPDLESFENDWNEFRENFDCSYFEGFDKEVDLNSDEVNEIFIYGKYSRYKSDGEMFVFQKQDQTWKMILY